LKPGTLVAPILFEKLLKLGELTYNEKSNKFELEDIKCDFCFEKFGPIC